MAFGVMQPSIPVLAMVRDKTDSPRSFLRLLLLSAMREMCSKPVTTYRKPKGANHVFFSQLTVQAPSTNTEPLQQYYLVPVPCTDHCHTPQLRASCRSAE